MGNTGKIIATILIFILTGVGGILIGILAKLIFGNGIFAFIFSIILSFAFGYFIGGEAVVKVWEEYFN